LNDLIRWASGSPEKRAKQAVVEETKLAGLKIDAEAALTGRIMERAVDVDSHRRALAGNDETLNHILTRIELNFVTKAERIQRSLGSEFPL